MAFSLFNIFRNKKADSSDGDLVTNSLRIGSILHQLYEDGTLLGVKVPGNDKSFTSSVIEFDRRTETFSLDEISSEEGHELFLKKKKLKINCLSRGSLLSFTVSLKKLSSANEIGLYIVGFPKSIKAVQRRAYYRARVNSYERIRVTTVHESSGAPLSGYVLNISTHGISLAFNSSRNITRGDILTLCQMKLPEGQQLTFDLNVRNSQKLPNDRVRVGAIFREMKRHNQDIIEKFIRKIDRDTLRKG